MNEEDMQIINNLLRATKAVVGIGDGAPIHVQTTVPVEGRAHEIEIDAWKCGSCEEIHTTVTVVSKNTLIVVEPEAEGDLDSIETDDPDPGDTDSGGANVHEDS